MINSLLNHYDKSKISEQTKIREILQQTALLGLERQGFLKRLRFMVEQLCAFFTDLIALAKIWILLF